MYITQHMFTAQGKAKENTFQQQYITIHCPALGLTACRVICRVPGAHSTMWCARVPRGSWRLGDPKFQDQNQAHIPNLQG